MPANDKHVSCGWKGCEQVNFGPIPTVVIPGYHTLITHDARIDFELRIRQHDKTKGHMERKLVWKEI